MVNYEVLFVIDPTLDDDKKDAAIERVKEVISSEGQVGDVDVWGLRKLAYPIQKKNEGYYVVIQFQAEPTLPAELDRRFKISDDFIRHIIVCKDEKSLEADKLAREAVAKKVAERAAEEAAREEAAKAAKEAEEAAAEEVADDAEPAVEAEEVVEAAEETVEEAAEVVSEEATTEAE